MAETFRWPGAVGYNILWGLKPEKLYQTCQVFADRPTTLELRALNIDQEYWVAMKTQTTKKPKRTTTSLFTTVWGWFTAPRFGSAGSGGLNTSLSPSGRPKSRLR